MGRNLHGGDRFAVVVSPGQRVKMVKPDGRKGRNGNGELGRHRERWPAHFRAAGHRRGQGLAGRRRFRLGRRWHGCCVRERVGPGGLQGLVCNFGLGWKGLGFVVGLMGNCLWLKGFGGVGACAVHPGHRRVVGAVVGRLREFCGLWRNGEPPHGL